MMAVVSASCGSSDAETDRAFAERYLESLLGLASAHEDEEVTSDYLRLEEQLIERCMTDAGFDYVAAPAESVYIPLGYSDDEMSNAEKFGFGISTIDPSAYEAASNPNDAIIAALAGTNEGVVWNEHYVECADLAHAETVERHGVDRAQSIAAEVEARVRADRSVIDAETQWSACMGNHGFMATDPIDLVEDLQSEFASVETSGLARFKEREIAAAVADVRCGEELRQVEADARLAALRELSPSDYEALVD